MLSNEKIKDLEKQGYRMVGNHSGIKVCLWTKKAIRCQDVCYKNTFYGIQSHRCVQMTPSLNFCNQRCSWCWRDIEFTKPKWSGKADNPKDIIDGCIAEQIKYLQGFGGSKDTDFKRFREALKPLHFAISLSGEPTLYPKLPELIKELKKRNITSFLVTNGTNSEMLEKLIKQQPTQLYLTLPAPDEETYRRVCSPLVKDSWKKINQSLKLLKKFNRSVIRLTLAKNINMIKPENYAELVDNKADFVEAKAYMFVGYSRQRLTLKDMPRHHEIMKFARIIAKKAKLKIIDEKKESRVVLMMKKDFKERVMEFK